MKRLLSLATFSTILLAAGAVAAPAKSAAPPAIDPNAVAALKRMSATLAGAKTLTYRAESVVEVPAATGQFLTLFSSGNVALERPNKLRASFGGEAPRFDFFYDGETVTAYAPGTKVYSKSKAPATIDEMLAGLRAETGIRFASAPLLASDPYAIIARDLTSAVVVGPATVNGVECAHLAFRAPGVNWEIWVETSARTLPRRLAVTFTDEPGLPRTLVEFSRWSIDPWFGVGSFSFTPPADAKEIPFNSVLESADRR